MSTMVCLPNYEDKQEWLNILEEEERTASIYEDVEEIVYDKDDGELIYTLLLRLHFSSGHFC